jgi:hypothetical protein
MVIIEAMVLIRDMASNKIEDSANHGGMLEGHSKVEATVSPRFPFWNLLSVLEHRIEDVNGAVPDVGTLEVVII